MFVYHCMKVYYSYVLEGISRLGLIAYGKAIKKVKYNQSTIQCIIKFYSHQKNGSLVESVIKTESPSTDSR